MMPDPADRAYDKEQCRIPDLILLNHDGGFKVIITVSAPSCMNFQPNAGMAPGSD
jgi:hypothetical protein